METVLLWEKPIVVIYIVHKSLRQCGGKLLFRY